jgi:hypothetical protein
MPFRVVNPMLYRARSLAILVAAASWLCAETPASNPVNVRIAGGLLGHLGGFCEDPVDQKAKTDRNKSGQIASKLARREDVCPPGQTPFGGLLSLGDAWSQDTDVYKLLAGNNLPKNLKPIASVRPELLEFAKSVQANLANGTDLRRMTEQTQHQIVFLDQLALLHADVIALGQEDLIRTMLPALDDTPASRIFQSAREFLERHRRDLPFLASNAFVRKSRKNINSVRSGGYELQLNADQSIPWGTTDFSVRTPLFADVGLEYSATVCGIDGSSNGSKKLKASGGIVKFSIDFLRAASCDVVLTAGSGAKLTFRVEADEVLTPFANAEGPGPLKGSPAAYLTGHGSSMFVVAMIDPSALTLLESDRWKMTLKDGTVEELVLADPSQTAKALFARLGEQEAVAVLLSDLNDTATLQMLRTSSRWRIVSLNPDTTLLGCSYGAKGCGKGHDRPFNLGSIAVIDQKGPRAQVWVRPEWLAETALRISGTALSNHTWDSVTAVEDLVADARGPIRTHDQSWIDRIWWKSDASEDETTQAIAYPLMEAMRKAIHTEVAVADKSMIDADAVYQIAREFEAKIITELGAQQFMEIFWRHDAYVRVSLTGTDLVTMLGAMNKLPVSDDGGYCVRGLRIGSAEMNCSIPQTVDIGTLRVNGRFADAATAYSVAIPQSLAQRLGLGDHKRARTDVLKGLRDFLQDSGLCTVIDCPKDSPRPVSGGSSVPPAAFTPPNKGAAPQSPASQAVTWKPNLFERRLLSMIYIPPAAIEVGGQDYRVPLQADGKTPDTSGFALVPNVNEKVTHTFKFNMVGELHLVPVDHPVVALDFVTRASLNRLDTYPTDTHGVKQIAYSPDLWTNGVYLRSRDLSDAANRLLHRMRTPDTLRIEPFIGVFDDTSIFHFDGFFQTAEKDPNDPDKPRYTFEELDRKPNYLYGSAGIAFGDIPVTKFLTARKTLYQYDRGTNFAVPTGLLINAHSYTIDQARRCGIQTLLDKDSPTCPKAYDATAVPDTNIRYTYGEQKLSRHQVSTSFEFAWGATAATKRTITLGVKGYAWRTGSGASSPLDPKYTSEFNITAALPVGKGITIGPYVRYLLVKTYGASTFMSDRYGFTFVFPFIGKMGAGRTIY